MGEDVEGGTGEGGGDDDGKRAWEEMGGEGGL